MSPYLNLSLATTSFVGTHFLLSHPLRKHLARRMGEKGFLALYSAVAFATFGWMIFARLRTDSAPTLWLAEPWAWEAAAWVMLFAAVLLIGSLRGNPAMVDPDGRIRAPAAPTGVLAITRHPMMWAFILWAIVHIILWGSAANIILSSGILILAFGGSLAQDAKKRRLLGPDWVEWQRKTAFVPFMGQLMGRVSWKAAWPGWFALLGGLAFWMAATWAHVAAGGPPAGIWRWIG